MSSLYDNLLNNLQSSNPFDTSEILPSNQTVEAVKEIPQEQKQEINVLNELPLFSIENFTSKLKKKSHNSNKSYHNNSYNINAYDIAAQCARIPFFRIKDYPVRDYSSSWLPLSMRGHIGNSVHDFIQSVDLVFSETEVCLKIPSLQISVRADALINDSVLVEIKSCTYSDYDTIIKTNAPRNSDFYQAVFYKYLLETYLEEIKQQQPSRNGSLPKLDKYNIKYIQLIYVCHELISSDSSTLNEDLKFSKELKRKLDSKRNPFWFITTLTVDLSKTNIKVYENYLMEKYKTIKTAIDSNVIIPMSNQFIDTKGCYFCVYKQICEKYR
jgi:hypothetical protein